jgi:hypothetical protein
MSDCKICSSVPKHFFYSGATSPQWAKSPLTGLHDCTQTPHSVALLWTSDQPDAETSTWQHTTLTTDRHPCPPGGFEPTIPASDRPQTHALEGAATGWTIPTLASCLNTYSEYTNSSGTSNHSSKHRHCTVSYFAVIVCYALRQQLEVTALKSWLVLLHLLSIWCQVPNTRMNTSAVKHKIAFNANNCYVYYRLCQYIDCTFCIHLR